MAGHKDLNMPIKVLKRNNVCRTLNMPGHSKTEHCRLWQSGCAWLSGIQE
jgi:hypothetical protein